MSVEKRRDGYTVRWRDSDGRARSKQVRLWRDAVSLDSDMKRKKAMGELVVHEKGNIQLQDFWEVWWTNYAIPNLTPRTRETYSHLWRVHVRPALGRTRLRSLSIESAAAFGASLSPKLAPSSARQCLAVLQGVMERAVEWGYVSSNPVKGVRRPKLVKREGRAITADEVQAVITELPDLRSKTIVRVLAGTGMRPGELRALCWRDVTSNWRRFIRVTRAVSSNQVGPTKTNGLRTVEPSHGRVWWDLSEWHLANRPQSPHDLVFPGANGRLWTDQGWRMWQRQVFSRAAARAGLVGLRPYDLRHTYASQQIAQGVDILTLASRLGHSPTMTLTVYGHLMRSKSVYSECAADLGSDRIPRARRGI